MYGFWFGWDVSGGVGVGGVWLEVREVTAAEVGFFVELDTILDWIIVYAGGDEVFTRDGGIGR